MDVFVCETNASHDGGGLQRCSICFQELRTSCAGASSDALIARVRVQGSLNGRAAWTLETDDGLRATAIKRQPVVSGSHLTVEIKMNSNSALLEFSSDPDASAAVSAVSRFKTGLLFYSESMQFGEGATASEMIPLADVQLGDMVGSGAYGSVFKAAYLGKQAAAKMIKLSVDTLQNTIGAIQKEVAALSKLQHVSIMRYHGIAQDTDRVCMYIITEFCQTDLEKVRLPHSTIQFQRWSKQWCSLLLSSPARRKKPPHEQHV